MSQRILRALVWLALSLALFGCSKGGSPAEGTSGTPRVFRVVRSKQLTALAVIEKQRTLEAALKPLGVGVRWLEFAAGPQQMEAVNAGELDLALTAESPPAFAQAADGPIVYLAHLLSAERTRVILASRYGCSSRFSALCAT